MLPDHQDLGRVQRPTCQTWSFVKFRTIKKSVIKGFIAKISNKPKKEKKKFGPLSDMPNLVEFFQVRTKKNWELKDFNSKIFNRT